MDAEFANAPASGFSPEEVSQLGEKFYFDELRDLLEKNHRGEYIVLDVANKKYVVDPDKLRAIENAEKQLGKQLFYIIQVGSLQRPVVNFKKRAYAWQF